MKIRLFKKNEDKYILRDSNILFLTGLPGSGKNYESKKLIKEFDYELIKLEWLKYPKKASKIIKNIQKGFIKKYPKVESYMKNNFNDNSIKKDIVYKKYMKLYIDYLLNNLSTKKKYIIEGEEIFLVGNTKKILKNNLLIKQTSLFKSYKNIRLKYKKEKLLKRFNIFKNNIKLINLEFYYYNKLNKFIKEISI